MSSFELVRNNLGDGSVSTPEVQSPAPRSGDVGPYAELGTLHLQPSVRAPLSVRWQWIQARFVDDPQQSAAEAAAIVSELFQRCMDEFRVQRELLERRAEQGSLSTEELRVALQRYREWIERLAPCAEKAHLGSRA